MAWVMNNMSFQKEYEKLLANKIEKPELYPKGKHYVIIRFTYHVDRGYPDAVHHEILVTTNRSTWVDAVAYLSQKNDKIVFYEVEKTGEVVIECTASIT
jgi:hypothetical protein